MRQRIGPGCEVSRLPAFNIALACAAALAVSRAGATVHVSEPTIQTISNSDIICVAKVDRVLGTGADGRSEPARSPCGGRPSGQAARPAFTNKNPPDVMVTVRDGIKGAERRQTLRVVGWVAGRPSSERRLTEDDVRRWEAAPAAPPAVGAEVLLFLKRRGSKNAEQVRGVYGPVFLLSPDPRTIELVRGTAWISLQLRPMPEVWSRGRPFLLAGTITNHSPGPATFDFQRIETRADMPMGLKDGEFAWRPHPPPPLRLGPGETREYSFDIERISPLPIGLPGQYWFYLRIPANVNGQGSGAQFWFRVEGPMRLWDAAIASQVVCIASVDSIHRYRPDRPERGMRLGNWRYLRGGSSVFPGALYLVNWNDRLPLQPIPGRQYIFFYNDWHVFHVVEASRANIDKVQAALDWLNTRRSAGVPTASSEIR